MVIGNATLIALVCALPIVQEPRGAEPPPPASVAPAAKPTTDADALRGPTLAKHPERPERSIVERDFQGRLKKLDSNPALVGLGKLTLGDEERARAEKIIADRATALDTLVRDNLKLIIEYAQAKEAKDSEAINKFQPLVLEKASPYFKRGPLLREVRPALTDEHAAELKRMVDEYHAVASQERMGDPMSGPQKENKVGAILAQGFEGFGAEVRASVDRVINGGGKEFELFLAKLQLTPEQEGKIRQKAGDLFQKTYGKTTKLQQLQLFMDIYSTLDVEQRHKLAEAIGEENRVKRGSAKK